MEHLGSAVFTRMLRTRRGVPRRTGRSKCYSGAAVVALDGSVANVFVRLDGELPPEPARPFCLSAYLR